MRFLAYLGMIITGIAMFPRAIEIAHPFLLAIGKLILSPIPILTSIFGIAWYTWLVVLACWCLYQLFKACKYVISNYKNKKFMQDV